MLCHAEVKDSLISIKYYYLSIYHYESKI